MRPSLSASGSVSWFREGDPVVLCAERPGQSRSPQTVPFDPGTSLVESEGTQVVGGHATLRQWGQQMTQLLPSSPGWMWCSCSAILGSFKRAVVGLNMGDLAAIEGKPEFAPLKYLLEEAYKVFERLQEDFPSLRAAQGPPPPTPLPAKRACRALFI